MTNLEKTTLIITSIGLIPTIFLFGKYFLAKKQSDFGTADLCLKAGIVMIVLLAGLTAVSSAISKFQM